MMSTTSSKVSVNFIKSISRLKQSNNGGLKSARKFITFSAKFEEISKLKLLEVSVTAFASIAK